MTEYDLKRYQRQIILPDFGEEGQQKLLNAKVLVVGVGGLGLQLNFTDHFAMNVEMKYQYNVGNQYCATAGLLYIF